VVESLLDTRHCLNPKPRFTLEERGVPAFSVDGRPSLQRLVARPPSLLDDADDSAACIDGDRVHHVQPASVPA
jgi:hypothetical protein